MKNFYNLLYTNDDQADRDNIFHFNINEDVRKSFASIKSIVIDLSLLVVGFITIVWVFGALAGVWF